ncbi:ABC transporter ATP-binding protein [Enterocloster citroniae]|jgi:ABC-2 type transport system ATP-binding protein|uniref:ABC-2 type transport system ATP-binding protein n=4 Tax=Enterocloster citroniae TaxID=358743 RepID=A0ABV2G104_9FIRM
MESEETSMENAINIRGLSKTYKDFSLKDVNLSLPKGSIMGLIGENGAGKSTTIKAMLDLVRRDSGTIEILGKDLDTSGKEIREQIGVILGESHFHEFLNAIQVSNIMKRVYGSWDQNLFLDYLKTFSLPEKKKIKEYSKGMMMKLSIAAALSHHPKLLILDEATSGLDPIIRDEILDIFFGFIEDGEHSILISSHITSDLDKVADYITMIHDGEILFSEEKDFLMDDMGIIKCGAGDLNELKGLDIVGVRHNAYQAECLVRSRQEVSELYPDLIIDRANIEEIMLFYIRGQKQ